MSFIVYVALYTVVFFVWCGILCYMYLCLNVVPVTPGKTPFSVQNNIRKKEEYKNEQANYSLRITCHLTVYKAYK